MVRPVRLTQGVWMDGERLEVWGGVEYTCNRVHDRYFDQMTLSGHDARASDLQRFRSLGVTSLRTGVLWERHELDPSWRFTDARLTAIRDAGLRPIAGLVHHGSGPRHTDLLDPAFPGKLAAYAGEVAARYPWLGHYTPINEPNTTARFSSLYGFWYPHCKSPNAYLRALLNQIKATVLAMRAIREVNSDAQLIQTDDAGRIYSTPELAATRDLLNERRWLQIDLLCGRVDHAHPLFGYILGHGIPEDELLWFRDNPCPPSVVGLNYYVTSDRYLDHRRALHPHLPRCDEGPFLDLEAVRVREEGITGFGSLLFEADARFGLPTAITEVHLGDRVEEQMRWAVEAWNGAIRAREAGVRCLAVTFWALLGSYFWSSLVTRDNGHYEPGVFDVSRGEVRETELAQLVRQLARIDRPQRAEIADAGWWHHPSRLLDRVSEESQARNG